MVDTPANQAPVKDDAIAHLYGRKGATTGDGFVKYAENQFAHAVGLSASDKGKTPYVDANGDMARLAIGANGSLMTAATGLPTWLAPGTNTYVLTMVAGAPVWSAVSTVDRLIQTQTISSPVASVVFTGIPSSGYSKFVLVGSGVVSARTGVTDETLAVHVSTDGGSTWKTTSGDYYSDASAFTTIAAPIVPANNSTFKYGSFTIDLIGLGNSGRATTASVISVSYGISATNIAVDAISDPVIKTRSAAEADNAIRVISGSGNNLNAGSISLYGVLE